MRKKIIGIAMLLVSTQLTAQTWDGSAGTNWNDPANWSTNAIPLASGNVTIPNTANKPVLASNVTIASFSMTAGSGLNFNGFSLSVTGGSNIAGATISNSNAATDIVMTLNSAGSSGANYIGSTTITDHVTLNFNGTGTSYEGYSLGNIFTGNATFNIGGTGRLYTSYNQKSSFSGNLTVNRTVAGITDLFNSGFTSITGNFSYTNNFGGDNYINSGNILSGSIGGTVNITVAGSGNPDFYLKNIKNLTPGGTISVQNSGTVDIENDTLLLTALSVTGFTGASTDGIYKCRVTGTVTFAEAASNTGAVYVWGNDIYGNTTLTTNAAVVWYEGHTNGNIYNGNTSFNINGTGTFYSSYNQKSSFAGNLTVNRTGIGVTDLFNNGFASIAGNFSYTNNAGGNNFINSGNIASGAIGGTVNITVAGSGNPDFYLKNIKNLTPGGTISVQNSGTVDIENDTLLLTALSVTGFTGASTDGIYKCRVTGTVTFAEAATNTGAVYLWANIFNGNTTLTTNAAVVWYEGFNNGNIYNGNTSFNVNGTGTFYSSYNQKCSFAGNLTVTRTAAGITDLFNSGFNFITGNFSFTNNAGGNTFINSNNILNGPINGTVNITATGAGNPTFYLFKIKNLTTGGTISVQNSGYTLIRNDTLAVTALNVNGFTGSSSDELTGNHITGNVTFSDAATNTGAVYIGTNTINGNSVFTANAATIWYESYNTSDRYNGDVSFIRNGTSTFNIAYNDTLYASQNLTLNSSAGFDINTSIEFVGNSNALLEQLGTQPIVMPRLIMRKTGSGFLTLNDSVTVTTTTSFISGNIYTSIGKELIFPNGITHTGVSATSHVIGPVIKLGAQAFVFPVGSPNTLNTIAMSAPVGATSRFRAAYILQNPSINGLNTSNKAGSLSNVSNAGYWQMERLIGATNVNLTMGFGSNPYHQFPALANLKVAQWSGSQWDDKGNGGTTGSATDGTIVHSGSLTSYTYFALANQLNLTYLYSVSNPGTGPDGTPVKVTAVGGYPAYQSKQLPAGSYTADSIYLLSNGGSSGFKLRDALLVEKDDTTVTLPAVPPTNYVSSNATGMVNFSGWRHFVYVRNGANEIIGAIRDNNLTLGNTTMQAFFASGNIAMAPNGQLFLKRSFKVIAANNPVGTKRVRLYISKTEFNNLVAADPAAFPNGINSLHLYKYTGPQEDAVYNPKPGGVATIIQPASITKADLGTMYSLDVDVAGFSGFYATGLATSLSICPGSTIDIPSNISGASYQWQLNTGSGFSNLSNSAGYNGVTTATLSVINAPSNMYGYQYRCMVNGGTPSQTFTIKFSTTWQGTANNIWENPANWPCGVVPDANTDITIATGKLNYPQVGVNSSVRTLRIETGTSVTVKAGFKLTVAK